MELLSTYLTLRLSALQVLPYSRITLPPWAAKMPNQNPLVSNGWSSFSFGVRTTGVAKGKSTCNEEEAEEEEKKKCRTHTQEETRSEEEVPHRAKDTSLLDCPNNKWRSFQHWNTIIWERNSHMSSFTFLPFTSRAEECTIKTIKHRTTLTHPGCRPRSMSTGEDTPPGKMFWGDRTPLCLLS